MGVSMMHACALAVVAEQKDENFPVIDIEGLSRKYLSELRATDGRKKVHLVYQWVVALIVKNLENGTLNIPPPILSRVFHELDLGMRDFNIVLQLMTVPIPFPYAQAAVFLLMVYMLITPVAMSFWTDHGVTAFLFSFLAVMCMMSLELIAEQLENPFGDDHNDLPCLYFQEDLNDCLLVLVNPASAIVQQLGENAVLDYYLLTSRRGCGFTGMRISRCGAGWRSLDELLVMEPEGTERDVLEASSWSGSQVPAALPPTPVLPTNETKPLVDCVPTSMQWLEQLLTEQFKDQMQQTATLNQGLVDALAETLPFSVREILEKHLKTQLDQQASLYRDLRASLDSQFAAQKSSSLHTL